LRSQAWGATVLLTLGPEAREAPTTNELGDGRVLRALSANWRSGQSALSKRRRVQRADGSNPCSRNLDECFTAFERADDRAEVSIDTAQQFRAARVSCPDLHDSRTAMQNVVDREVLVLRDDHCRGARSALADGIVGGRRETTICDMLRHVTDAGNLARECWRKLRIDEKAQSSVPEDGVIALAGSELQHRRDVVRFEVWVVGEDLFVGRTGGEQIEHVLHTDAKTADARTAAADVGTDRDAIHPTHAGIVARTREPNDNGWAGRIARATDVMLFTRAWSDGTTRAVFEPGELLERLAVLTPRPRVNLILYHGVLAPRAAWRRLAVAFTGRAEPPATGDGERRRDGAGLRWAELMRRTFGIDVLACPRCGGRLRLLALIDQASVIARVLGHLGLPSEVPGPRPARAPPLVFADHAELVSDHLAEPDC
jgi:hypothetical protein